MESKTATGLTLMDIAILADGQGNIPDDTAERLAPFVCRDDRLQSPLEQLAQMAADAGVRHLADGLDAAKSVGQLRQEPWESPTDVLDSRLDVPYAELIAMAASLAERAEGEEKAELLALGERLARHLGGEQGAKS